MRKLSSFILALLLASCLSEKNIDPANANTFTRYFSDGFANEPVAVEETPDHGFIILVNTNFKNTDAELSKERIQLIKIDAFGQLQWQQYFPSNDFETTAERWRASSIMVGGEGNFGYTIIGEKVTGTGALEAKSILLFQADSLGNKADISLLSNETNFTGKAVARNKASSGSGTSYYVLAQATDNATNNILLTELSSDFSQKIWTRKHVGGPVTLNNKLYFRLLADQSDAPGLCFGGYRTYSDNNVSSFIGRTLLNSGIMINGLQDLGTDASREFMHDFCLKGAGFGIIGDIQTGSSLSDIFFMSLSSTLIAGDTLDYKKQIFDDLKYTNGTNVKAEIGNAIHADIYNSGGYIIAATIDTYTGILGRGNTDMYLMKTLSSGQKVWHRTYGSPDADAAVSVRPTSDGGYVLLGRSRLAALNTTVLIKTDKNGDVD